MVLDHGLGLRSDRDDYKQLVTELGGRWRLLFFQVDRSELLRRLALRNAQAGSGIMTVETLDWMIRTSEPCEGEGEELITARDAQRLPHRAQWRSEAVFTLRPNLPQALADAQQTVPVEPVDWLKHPPPKAHRLDRTIQLPDRASITECGSALLNWEVHRLAGLRTLSTGPAHEGATVVLGIRIGPVWAVAPCRVIEAVQTEQLVAFSYTALPGHPEAGTERFAFVRDENGARFEVSAVSRHVFWGSRLVPFLAGFVQGQATGKYLRAGRSLA